MSDITEELLERFFKGECTPEEASRVMDFLRKNPDHTFLLRDWESADGYSPLPAGLSEEMLAVVEKGTGLHKKRISSIGWRLAAAACVAALLTSIFFLWPGGKTARPFAERTVAPKAKEWETIFNTTDTARQVSLADGSTVTLWPGGSLRYSTSFGRLPERNIYMEGEAVFEVAKDKTKPFRVFSGALCTRALGTVFRVTAPKGASQLKVKLNEGKVMITAPDSAQHAMPTFYLLPGEELVFDAGHRTGVVRSFIPKKIAAIASRPAANKAAVQESFMFNNQTLSDVLEELAAIYRVKINYSEQVTGKIYFIGEIDTHEPLEQVLGYIALPNNLTVSRQNNGFTITRHKRPGSR